MSTGGTIGILAQRLKRGEPMVSAWCSLGDPTTAELLIRAGFDTAVLDMQHGNFTVDSATTAIAQVALAGAPAIVRIPIGEFQTASRMLDAGAAAIIAPMINSVADAKAFASAMKLPPLGDRSWGPHGALRLSGLDPQAYLKQANDIHMAFAMIETQVALDALDDILAVPGIDGVLVGPSDLSITLSGGTLDPHSAQVDKALDHIAGRVKAAGKVAALFCVDGARAKVTRPRGYALRSIATDMLLLRTGASVELAAERG